MDEGNGFDRNSGVDDGGAERRRSGEDALLDDAASPSLANGPA